MLRGDLIAQRSILRSNTSAAYHAVVLQDTVPRDSATSAMHANITAPYSKWVKANDYTNDKRTLALDKP